MHLAGTQTCNSRHTELEPHASRQVPFPEATKAHTHHSRALTGMFSMMMRFTVDTSLVRTQYLVVERLKACGRQHKEGWEAGRCWGQRRSCARVELPDACWRN